jgi:hypothetical protein
MAALIRAMAAAGAGPEAIAIAVEAIEGAAAEVEARRAGDRERKRRQRDKSRDGHGTVTGHSGDKGSSKEVSPAPLQETQLQSPPSPPSGALPPANRSKAKRCPPSYEAGPRVLAVAETEGFTPGEIERELAKFKDHQFRDAHTDWDAAFRNWLRRASETKPRNVHALPAKSAKRAAHEANMDRALRGAETAARIYGSG